MSETPIEIDVHTLRTMQQSGVDFLLLDCRNPMNMPNAKSQAVC